MNTREMLKRCALAAHRVSGLEALARHKARLQPLILCYHGVIREPRTDRFGYENTVSEAEFRSHLEFLARHFRVVTAAELWKARAGSEPLENAALITFDDGYRNNAELAAKILREVGVPAVFFVSTGYIGTRRTLWPTELMSRILAMQGEFIALPRGDQAPLPQALSERRRLVRTIRDTCKQLPCELVDSYLDTLRAGEPLQVDEEANRFMTWDEVRQLRSQSFEIGAHTVDHPILTRAAPDRLRRELAVSKETVERELGAPCPWIAYPNGGREDVSPQVFEAARAAGYKLGFTLFETRAAAEDDDMALSRICVQGHLPEAYFRLRASRARAA